MTWADDAACTDHPTWLFFDAAHAELAKKVCARCPVIDHCRTYALDNHEEHGVWGGMDEKERRKALEGVSRRRLAL